MKNFTLIVVYILFWLAVANGQTRVTDITNEEQNLKYCLMKTHDKSYVVTIAPDDLIEFYQINPDQSFDLVNSVTIPTAYATDHDKRYAEHGHFIIINNTHVINYNLESDLTIYHSLDDNQNNIDNTLHPDHIVSWNDYYFDFGTDDSFLYDYTRDILYHCNHNILQRHKNNVAFFETKNDSSYLYYAEGNCFNKELIYKFRIGPDGCDPEAFVNSNYSFQFDMEMYPTCLYYIDSIGTAHKYDYETGKNTKIAENQRGIDSGINVLETETAIVIIYPGRLYSDSTYLDFYDKVDYTFKSTITLSGSYHGNRFEIKEYYGKFIINPENGHILYWDSNIDFFKNMADGFICYSSRPYFHGDSYVFPVKKGTQNYFQLGDIYSNKSNLISIGNTYSFPFVYRTEEVKVGDHTYFNWVSKTGFKSIFVYDKTLKQIKPIEIGNFNQGVSRKSPLVKIGNRQYLLNEKCLEIFEDKYKIINDKPLTSLIYTSDDKYRFSPSGIIFAENNGSFKSIFLLQNGNKKIIQQLQSDTKVYDVNAAGDYVIWVDVNRIAILINTKTNARKNLTNGLWPFKNARYILTDGKFFYLRKLDATYIYDPVTDVLKSLEVKENLNHAFVTRINDAGIIIIDNKLCKINNNYERDIINIGLPNYTNSNYVEIKNNELYSLAQSNNLQYLYKYDGSQVKIITSAPYIFVKNISDKGILFQSGTSTLGPLTTMFYDRHKDKVYRPAINAFSNITQIFNHKNNPYALVQTADSIQIIKFTDDYISSQIIFSEYSPLKIFATSLGETPDKRTLVSTGRSFYFMDENDNTTRLKDIIPNDQQHNIFINDSVFYFMAIDRPLGNQVYSLNHQELAKLTSTFNETSIHQTFNIYPNPANNQLTITTIHQMSACKLSVFNINGKQVLSQEFSESYDCDLSDIPSGVYLCLIKCGSDTFRSKLIKI